MSSSCQFIETWKETDFLLCPGLPGHWAFTWLNALPCLCWATSDLSNGPNSHLCGRVFQISQRPSYQFLLACQVSKSGSVWMGLLCPCPLVFLLMFKAFLLHFLSVLCICIHTCHSMRAEVRGQPGGICAVDSGISRLGSWCIYSLNHLPNRTLCSSTLVWTRRLCEID